MSITRNTPHTVGAKESLSSLVVAYRLSSAAAIINIESNASIRSQLTPEGDLPVGLVIQIPPNAQDILRKRMSKLNELKPVLLAHFNTLQELTDAELLPALSKDVYPFDSVKVTSVLQNLDQFSKRAIDDLSKNSKLFVELASAMSRTHVSSAEDHELAAASDLPFAGLIWAISRIGLIGWHGIWTREFMDSKWSADSSAATATMDSLTTIRSIVIQQVDRRFRESLILQNRLLAE